MAKNNSFQNRLVEAHSFIQQGKYHVAIDELTSLLKHLPQNADAAHLMALAYKGLGDANQASDYFQRSLELNKRQPQVYNNLANLQKANKDYENAEQNYLKAISMHPTYLEAHRNLAICYMAQDSYDKTIQTSLKALEIKPNDVETLVLLANAHRQLGEFDQATKLYQDALSLDSTNLSVWHNLGISHHLQHQLENARECYQRAYDLSPDTAAVVQSLALVTNELGFSQKAAELFSHYLSSHADDVSMHERFNDMLWETDLQAHFGRSYQHSIKQFPQSSTLRVSYLSQLFRAGLIELASSELAEAEKALDNTPQLLSLKGLILAEQQQYAEAAVALTQALDFEFSQSTAQQLVKLYIIEGAYDTAQTWLNQLMQRFPDCQLNWAYQSIIWRLTDDERYCWLMNYEQFIRSFILPTPSGYSNLDEFLVSLDEVLSGLHLSKNAPLQQTLRNGTQTSARLLHNPIHECRLLKNQLSTIVEAYIDELPDDLSHPFLRRKSAKFDFSGSWSVKLRPQGFHVNHVHPDGWISSSFYVSIPKSMQSGSTEIEGSGDSQGCIKFGESPLSLGERESIEKIVRPEPGLVVLFPSYCWHGTVPFVGSESDYRMTAPFDIVPL